jgi:hypothetical protein
VRSATAPNPSLQGPPEYPGLDGLVTRRHFWASDEDWRKVFKTLTATTLAGFTVFSTGGGAKYGEEDVDYSANTLPAGIAYAHLLIEVIPHGKTGSAIGVYAEAAPEPPRPAKENVPTSTRTVALRLYATDDNPPLHRKLTGRLAAKLVTDFNAMSVAAPGESTCLAFTGSWSASFTAAGHTWVATIDACPDIQVTRDGHQLPDLNSDSPFYGDLLGDLGDVPGEPPAAEQVPASLRLVQLTEQHPPSQVVVPATVTGQKARNLVTDFDQLQIVKPAHLHCSVLTGPDITATFKAGTKTWVASEDPCGLITVVRNGTPLPSLVTDDFWEPAVTAAFPH